MYQPTTLLLVGFIAIVRLGRVVRQIHPPPDRKTDRDFDETVTNFPPEQLSRLVDGHRSPDYRLSGYGLAVDDQPHDECGSVNFLSTDVHTPLGAEKKQAFQYREVDSRLITMVGAFLLTATFWLVFRTTVGRFFYFFLYLPLFLVKFTQTKSGSQHLS